MVIVNRAIRGCTGWVYICLAFAAWLGYKYQTGQKVHTLSCTIFTVVADTLLLWSWFVLFLLPIQRYRLTEDGGKYSKIGHKEDYGWI